MCLSRYSDELDAHKRAINNPKLWPSNLFLGFVFALPRLINSQLKPTQAHRQIRSSVKSASTSRILNNRSETSPVCFQVHATYRLSHTLLLVDSRRGDNPKNVRVPGKHRLPIYGIMPSLSNAGRKTETWRREIRTNCPLF